MRPSAALLVTVLLAVSAVAGVAAGAPADDRVRTASDLSESVLGTTENAPSGTDSPSSVSENAYSANSMMNETAANETVRDETKLHVSLHEDGDARWNVTAQFVLRDENETAAFRDLASRYENGNADAGPSIATFERIAERAGAETGREMVVRNVTRSARLVENGSVGVLSLSFTWTNFTQIDDRQIIMGDAFWLGSETWLPGLNEDQTLVFEAPDTYQITNANPSDGTISDGRVLRYDGPQTFDRGSFSLTYSPMNDGPTTDQSGVLPDLSGTSEIVLLLFLFGIAGVSAYAWVQQRGADPVGDGEEFGEGGSTGPVRGEAEGAEGTEQAASDSDAPDEQDEPVTELLSDEERVLRLLRDNDGRMKQAQIVKETNWSNAKVSQLLSTMDDDGDVDKLRIGRENLITLPDEDVTDTE
jgi:hypothetical protein